MIIDVEHMSCRFELWTQESKKKIQKLLLTDLWAFFDYIQTGLTNRVHNSKLHDIYSTSKLMHPPFN